MARLSALNHGTSAKLSELVVLRISSRQISYATRPNRSLRLIRSVAHNPAKTNSTHDARTASSSLAFTSNAFSHAGGTRLSNSA